MELAEQTSNISEKYLQSLKFPYKLWIIVNSQINHAIKWSHNDVTKILINTVLLEEYLCSTECIFFVKNITDFTKKLVNFGFAKCEDENNEVQLDLDKIKIFKNSNFNKNNYELIENIKKHDPLDKEYDDILPIIREINQFKKRKLQIKNDNGDKILDPCNGAIKKLSQLEKSRLILRTMIQVDLNQCILNERVTECDYNAVKSNELPIIQLPADVFENASESVSEFVEKTEYAGFYGNTIEIDKIKSFFSEYLPVYVHSNGEDEMMVNGIRVDERCNVEIEGFRSESYELDNNEKMYHESMANSEYSSLLNYTGNEMQAKALEPIFADDEDPNNEDITMDEYLKFNKNEDVNSDSELPKNEQDDKTKEEKLDKTDKVDCEDEDNFRNFFNQYRDSMNILYDS